MPEAYPKLRGEIDAVPASRDGETYYILHDRAGVTDTRLLVSPMGLLVAGRLDGARSVLDIADGLSREYGPVACHEVEQIVAALDEALFLDDARFQDYQAQAERDFRAAPRREAGAVRGAEPLALARELDAMLAAAPPPEEAAGPADRFPRGVVVPHIDYMRGTAGYGQAYAYLKRRPPPRTVVVAGTAHMPLGERYSLCEKEFDTPLGPVHVDAELCGKIRAALAGCCDVDRDVLAHRGEHSIELQAVWLRHVYGESIRIVPLLAASMGEFLDGERAPNEALREPAYTKMATVLSEAAATGEVMLMASADLSHVGPRFGDGRDISQRFLADVEETDRKYLQAAALDPLSGLESLAGHGDRHHVCGTAAVFTLGMALFGGRTRLLGYHQAVTPEMEQAVTYAAMVVD